MEPFNRVEAEMKAWHSREERFEKLFPGTLQNNTAFLFEKLDYLHRTQVKFGGTASDDESLALKILREERKQLERLLYPGIISRTLRGLLRAFVLIRANNRQVQQSISSSKRLIDEIGRIGLGAVFPTLQQRLVRGDKDFSILHSHYVNGKERMDFKLDVVAHGADYKIQGIHAVLHQDGKSETRKFHFNEEQLVKFNAVQAYNLLKGRAVQTGFITSDGRSEQVWRQLDFNDRDAVGNYRIKEFPASFAYNIENELQQLHFRGSQIKSLKADVLSALKNGDLVKVMLMHEGKERQFFLEAKPQQKTFGLYDSEMKKLSLSVFDAKPAKVQANSIKLNKIKKLDIVPSRQLSRSRSRGIN